MQCAFYVALVNCHCAAVLLKIMADKVIEVQSDDDFRIKKATAGERLIVIDFYATW